MVHFGAIEQVERIHCSIFPVGPVLPPIRELLELLLLLDLPFGIVLLFDQGFLRLGTMVSLESVCTEAAEFILVVHFAVAAHLVEVNSLGKASNTSSFEAVEFCRVQLKFVAFAEPLDRPVDEVVAGHVLTGVGLDGVASADIEVCSETDLKETGF